MKTRSFHPVFYFFSGVLFSLGLITLYAFTSVSNKNVSVSDNTSIGLAQAKEFIQNYGTRATPVNEVIKGINVNRAELSAMNSLVDRNPSLAGFRIYFGTDSKQSNVGIVVGMYSNGTDDANSAIYNTNTNPMGACPTLCDVSSPLMGQ